MNVKRLLGYVLFLSLLLISNPLYAQSEITVSGTVTEADTEYPLPGVNILVQGESSQGTITDIDGNYTINLSSILNLHQSALIVPSFSPMASQGSRWGERRGLF